MRSILQMWKSTLTEQNIIFLHYTIELTHSQNTFCIFFSLGVWVNNDANCGAQGFNVKTSLKSALAWNILGRWPWVIGLTCLGTGSLLREWGQCHLDYSPCGRCVFSSSFVFKAGFRMLGRKLKIKFYILALIILF